MRNRLVVQRTSHKHSVEVSFAQSAVHPAALRLKSDYEIHFDISIVHSLLRPALLERYFDKAIF
tara:strand:+ start:58 stop:249 length:192 start_codon:yes stop_codon:yes gene_type:complete